MRKLEFTLTSGVKLIAHAYGNPEHPPVILSHGGGQTRHSWGNTAKRLARHGWYAISYDHRGHGGSSWANNGDYHIERFAEDQRELAGHFSTRPVLVGASLGGMAAVLAEGESEDNIFRAIVLVDIVPRMNFDGVEHILQFMRKHMDEGFSSLDEAADAISKYTGRPRRKDLSGLKKNLRQDEYGCYRWHWDPDIINLHDNMDKLSTADRLDAAAGRIDVPILLVRGQMSSLVTVELAEEFLQRVPHARNVDIENARHMIAGDRNDVFSGAIEDFLAELMEGSTAA